MAKHKRMAITICGGKRLAISAGILLNILVLAGQPTLADTQPPSQTMVQMLDHLERLAGIQADPLSPLPTRIETLEQKSLGAVQYGALVERVARLRQVLEPGISEQLPFDETVAALNSPASLADSLPLLNAIPPNFLRIEPPDQPGDPEADYLSQVIQAGNNKVFHFASTPIPVLINNFPDRNFMSSVERGFETWEDRTGGTIHFVRVDDAAKARIQVVWKRLGIDRDATGRVIGAHTITKFTEAGKGNSALFTLAGVPVPMSTPDSGAGYSVPPQVIELNLDLIMSKSPTIRYRLLQNVVTHELGHALGLLGHSQNVNDMMYAVTDEHSRLSDRDINTLLKLYRCTPDVPL
ncbi:MAG TPA: matrixin family metalloprotease [Candidatus Obscuribacterales bacterium]